jgi:hypothetical protein
MGSSSGDLRLAGKAWHHALAAVKRNAKLEGFCDLLAPKKGCMSSWIIVSVTPASRPEDLGCGTRME